MNEIIIHRHTTRSGVDSQAFASSYSITPETPERRAILGVLVSGRLSQLVTYALNRRGYSNSDGGFGLVYPNEVEEEQGPESERILPNHVEIYTYWGPPDGEEYRVSEDLYLEVLALYLALHDRPEEAQAVDRFRKGV